MSERIEIRIEGLLDEDRRDWFDGIEIRYEGKTTVLICEYKDQAYVHGVLNKIRDLNLKLISVNSDKEKDYRRNHEKITENQS